MKFPSERGKSVVIKLVVILNLFQNLPYGLFCVSLSKKSYWKVSVQYLLFSSFFITTDPGLRLSRMTATTQDVDSENPAGRQFRMTPNFYHGFVVSLFAVIP